MKTEKKWNRKDYFIILDNKYKCKNCDKTYNKSISGSILKSHYLKNHQKIKERKITEFTVKKIGRNLRQNLIRFIVNGNHALNIVEEPDFKQLIVSLSPETQLPSRFTIKRDIETEFEDNRLKLKSNLSALNCKIGITTDIWTSMSERPYLSVTAHYVSSSRILCHVLLDFCYIPHPHSGEQMMSSLLEVFQEFNITEKITSITSDNATNNIRGIKLLNSYLKNKNLSEVTHFPCFGHVLNLSINEGIKEVSGILTNLRKIASNLKNSSKQIQKFEEIANALGEKYLRLKRDIHIRLNSTFEMIEIALKMRRVIDIICLKEESFKIYQINDNEWEILIKLCDFLRPFYESTKLLSGQSYSSICFVIPLFKHLLEHISSVFEDSLKTCSERIETKLKDYEKRLKTNCSYFAVIFDPRLNFSFLKTLLNDEEFEIITNEFKKQFNDYYTKYSDKPTVSETTQSSSSILSSIYKKRKLSEYQEIEKYSQLPEENSDIDPIEWWKKHETIYPCLSKYAFDVLCVTATSVPSEQIFSKAGIIITKRRNRLSDNTIRSVMCLNSYYSNFKLNNNYFVFHFLL